MEFLKDVCNLVKDLPSMALWIIAFVFIYKTVIIGSVYSVIRLAVLKIHDVMIAKHRCPVDGRVIIDGIAIDAMTKEKLVEQLKRLAAFSYVHNSGAVHLKQALDDYFAKNNINR